MNTPTRLAALAIAGSLVWGTSALAQAGLAGFANVDVNLRAGPDTGFPVVTVIPANANIAVIGCVEGLTWCDTEWNGNRGWVAGEFITYSAGPAPMPLPQVATQVQVPVVTYQVGPYWDAYYQSQPFYSQREAYAAGTAGGLVGGLGGAAVGAAVGGPVGAAIGGAIGAGAGAGAANPPAAPLTGALGGAGAGFLIGGPVGAAVGGAIGLGAGIAAIPPPPPPVQTYVTQQQVASIAIPGQVVVGASLPPPVILYPVPDYQYQFAIVNQQRVLVDPSNRQIVYIMQ